MNRIDRLTAIIIYLQGRKYTPVDVLAERYGISERTVFRDIRALEEAGVPLGSEPGKGYFIVKGYHLPPVMFSKSEATSLLAGERLMQRWNNSELGKSYQSALDKIRSTLPSEELQYFESLDEHISSYPYDNDYDPIPNEQIFTQLQNAIFNKEIVELLYSRPYSEEQTRRKVEPLGTLIMGRHWYLAAWCRLRDDYRMFRLDRIRKFTPTGIKLRQPPEHTLKSYYDEQLNQEQDLTEVVIRFDKEVARYVGDQKHWHGWAWEKPVGDTIEMTFLSASLEYMSRWLLRWVSNVNIIEPASLKQRMLHLSEELVRHYQSIVLAEKKE